MDDWALERESELVRLEYENYELRRMLGVTPPLSPQLSPPDFPTRLEATLEGDRQQGTLGMLTAPSNPELIGDLTLRRQPPHNQGQMHISLEAPLQPHPQTQPLHVAFPPDAPLVTRKYGRRAGSGSGSFIGGGGFMSTNVDGESSANLATGSFGPFRPPPASGSSSWQDNVTLGPGERNMGFPPSGQDVVDMSTPGQ